MNSIHFGSLITDSAVRKTAAEKVSKAYGVEVKPEDSLYDSPSSLEYMQDTTDFLSRANKQPGVHQAYFLAENSIPAGEMDKLEKLAYPHTSTLKNGQLTLTDDVVTDGKSSAIFSLKAEVRK